MARLRDLYQIKEVLLSDIYPEIVPLSYEKNLKNSLYKDGERQEQVEEIRLVPLDNGNYKYRYLDGRRRGETIRETEGNEAKIRAIIVPYNTEEEIHLYALTANSGEPNYPDESIHCAYLRDECGYEIKEIAQKTGLDYQVVRQRLLIRDNLIDRLFSMFQAGRFNYSCAWAISKLSVSQQTELVGEIESGEIETAKAIKEFCKQSQSEDMTKLFETFDTSLFENDDKGQSFNVGVVLSPEQMELIIHDETVIIEYEGKSLEICRCKW